MRFRKLRIAWSVGWGLAAVLLVALWVRSYRTPDYLVGPITNDHEFAFWSIVGNLDAEILPQTANWSHSTFDVEPDARETLAKATTLGFACKVTSNAFMIVLPHWFLSTMFSLAAAIPWTRQIPKQFSLRTLLIAMTLVAVVLGLIVWLQLLGPRA